jgi:hypothetical protein
MPRFNLREIAKQMVLLEDHLVHPYKQCTDCIRKHLLTIEAFAEEAVALDPTGVYRVTASTLAESARTWMESFEDGIDPLELAPRVRQLRKQLMQMVSDPRDFQIRIASRYLAASRVCAHQSPF